MRRLLPLLPLLLVACADDPLRRIPPTDRALLEAEARLGTGEARPSGRTSVEEMLARARGQAAPGEAAPGGSAGAPLLLRFAGADVQPDPAQLAQLYAFAARAGGRLVVTGARGDPALLGERRAITVARALEALGPPVELRFASGAPPDHVQIASAGGTPLAPAGGR